MNPFARLAIEVTRIVGLAALIVAGELALYWWARTTRGKDTPRGDSVVSVVVEWTKEEL